MPRKTAITRWLIGASTILAAAFLLAGCTAKPPSPSATLSASQPAILPSATLTHTPRPSKTPQPSLTPIPTHTAPPSATPTATLQAPTEISNLVFETPTPLPTPSAEAAAYQLKAWDAEAALGLVNIAEHFAAVNNVEGNSGRRANYIDDQHLIILAAQEALHRFPDADFKAKLEWQIALSSTIRWYGINLDEWILQQIESGLNSGLITPDTINQMLYPAGFKVNFQQAAPNLFADGQFAQVLWITRYQWDERGLYAALSQDDQEGYVLTKIASTWSFSNGYDWQPEITDHTGDGIPEVVVIRDYVNGSYNSTTLMIYQWQSDHFENIIRNQFWFNSYNETWAYGQPDDSGAESIEVWQASYALDVVRYSRYVWNGEWYELSESHLVPPERAGEYVPLWVTYAMHYEEYNTVIETLQQFLSDTSPLMAFNDYLRFQIGLAHAFQSNSTEARLVLEEIVQNPADPLVPAVSNAAQAYLDHYNGDADLYRACQAALQVMAQASGVQPFYRDVVDEEKLAPVWGYQPTWEWGSIALCDLSTAFPRIVAQLDATEFEQALAQLEAAGVLIRSAIRSDLNNDGQVEWVLLIDTPGDDVPISIWILLNTTQNILPIPLVSWERKPYDLQRADTDTATLDIKTVLAPDGASIVFLLAGEYLYAFQLDAAEAAINSVLAVKRDAESYVLVQRDDRLELEVPSPWSDSTYYYRWNGSRFVSFDPEGSLDALAEEAEAALFTRWEPGEAISPLRQIILDHPDYYDMPRMLYMLGLAYELSGDEAQAVQAYWELWHNYPESGYARLAQAKLELSK